MAFVNRTPRAISSRCTGRHRVQGVEPLVVGEDQDDVRSVGHGLGQWAGHGDRGGRRTGRGQDDRRSQASEPGDVRSPVFARSALSVHDRTSRPAPRGGVDRGSTPAHQSADGLEPQVRTVLPCSATFGANGMTLGFLILGPFEVHLDGEPLALGGRQQRALLAALTLRANELVSSERLIDELWPEDPPDTADHLVHVYVSRLRKALGDEGRPILVTRPPGYQLVLERGQVDLDRFEDHVAAARSATEEGRYAEASASLREALALWRGPALADVASESFARADAERLNELRVAATEDLMGVGARGRTRRPRAGAQVARGAASSPRAAPGLPDGGVVSRGSPSRGARRVRAHARGPRGGARHRSVPRAPGTAPPGARPGSGPAGGDTHAGEIGRPRRSRPHARLPSRRPCRHADGSVWCSPG